MGKTVHLTKEIHKELKIESVEQEKSIQELANELLEKELNEETN
jgi:predicted HicB family RNase H-like nuclease